jgi:hypothetical protein
MTGHRIDLWGGKGYLLTSRMWHGCNCCQGTGVVTNSTTESLLEQLHRLPVAEQAGCVSWVGGGQQLLQMACG